MGSKRDLKNLKLFMWKQYHLRKNRWFLSLIELLLPILIVYFVAKSAQSVISSEGIILKNATIYPVSPLKSVIINHPRFRCALYTPDLPELKPIIKGYKDYLKHVLEKDIMVYPVDNEQELEHLISNTNQSDFSRCIGIVFTNISAVTSKSGKFSYKLRNTDLWNPDEKYFVDIPQSDLQEGPISTDIYLNRGFLTVQLGLNKALGNHSKDKNDLYDNLLLSPFPYPEYSEENVFRSMVPTLVCALVLMTALILSIPLITTIIEEKMSGVKELMKIVGLKEWVMWTGWFLHALIFSLISYTIVTYILQHEFFGPQSAVIRSVNPLVLWFCIMLYCIANIAFCFMFAALFHQSSIASSMYVLTLALLVYISSLLTNAKYPILRRFMCLLPSASFYLAFNTIKYTEIHDTYLGWHNLFSADNNSSTLSLGYCFIMMIIDTFLYLFLAYYISAINPGKFGARKSPFFIFNYLKDTLNKNTAQELVNIEDVSVDRFIEKPPSNLEASIKIKDLHKNFGSVQAVKGVNLNVYKGEITALLGHNGAGKTTTLAILTGLIKPSEGSIIYKDKLDVLKRMDEFRQNLGMCPQEDRLFPYLTLKDHLLFFGRLKGISKKEAQHEAKTYMKLMEIEDKANSLVSNLSGGMKRKLCVSIALMGKAETLILDEPTSGLDVESRRKLWDLLMEMRGSRTIILTTHHMEEADALGDRIAIMHHGTIVCHGSSLFLKKSYNTGYQVTITKNDELVDEQQLTQVIQGSGIDDVTLEGSSPNEVVYKLPLVETSKFPNLFRKLESSKTGLGIESIGVSCTTMEQVFLKVGGISVYDPKMSSRRNSTVTDGGTVSKFIYSKKSGLNLIFQQIRALLYKKLLYTSRNYLNLFYRVIFPSFMVLAMLQGSQKNENLEQPLNINLAMYQNSKIMIQNTSDTWPYWKSFQKFMDPYGVEFVASKASNITHGLLMYGREDISSYKHDLILAMEMHERSNSKSVLLLYNRFILYSLPIGIDLYGDALMNIDTPNNKDIEFDPTIQSVPDISEKCNVNKADNLLLIWFIVLAFYTIDLNTFFITSINMERLDGFKHIQLMSNVSPLVYWLSNFIFDYVFFFLIILVRIILIKVFDDSRDFLSLDRHFAILMLILAISIASCLMFTYVFSYLSNSKDGSYLLLFILNILSTIVVFGIYMGQKFLSLAQTELTIWIILYRTLEIVTLLFPPMNYGLIFIKFFNTWSTHATCVSCEKTLSKPCPSEDYLVFQSEMHPDGILTEILFLVLDFFLYSLLLGCIQIGMFEKMVNKLLIKLYGNSASVENNEFRGGDDDVKLEKEKVDRLVNSSHQLSSENVLIVHNLRKNFMRFFRPITAVADINFTVKPGECFGLLGVNGAGKSTTFRMLTGDVLPTKGDSSIMGHKLSTKRTEYLSKAGYCAQSNCFLEELTGREMLSLIASLRGINSSEVNNIVDKWLLILGLETYQNRRCGGYSGGNKRKLCTAMSLIGDPAVVFLDEPTSGVDPVARRRLYTVMEQSRESGQAVVLTSHSMEECENLCDRLTILVKGKMQCIGSAQHLKQNYAQGFSILVKIVDTISANDLLTLKKTIENEFNDQCLLKDEHKTQLYYQITNVNLLWSTLFEKMENLKKMNQHLIDDYCLSDTSLEEVFISFAK